MNSMPCVYAILNELRIIEMAWNGMVLYFGVIYGHACFVSALFSTVFKTKTLDWII